MDLDVLGWHHEARRLAAWVGEVGDAFAAADSSPEPGPVVVGDEAALVAGPSPAQLRPPPLIGLLALLDLGSSPWIEARFPALAGRRSAARARPGEMAADRRVLAVEAYTASPTDRPPVAAQEARDGEVEAAPRAARATPAEVAAFVDLLDRDSVLELVVQLAVAL